MGRLAFISPQPKPGILYGISRRECFRTGHAFQLRKILLYLTYFTPDGDGLRMIFSGLSSHLLLRATSF